VDSPSKICTAVRHETLDVAAEGKDERLLGELERRAARLFYSRTIPLTQRGSRKSGKIQANISGRCNTSTSVASPKKKEYSSVNGRKGRKMVLLLLALIYRGRVERGRKGGPLRVRRCRVTTTYYAERRKMSYSTEEPKKGKGRRDYKVSTATRAIGNGRRCVTKSVRKVHS